MKNYSRKAIKFWSRWRETIWRLFLSLLGQINVIFVFLARNAVELHYFYRSISRIMIFTHRDRKISIFPNIFKFSRNISFERWSSAYIWPSAFIYVVISDINRTVEELFKKIYKILLESRLKESIWRFFVSLLDQMNVIFEFFARYTVELHNFYWNITRIFTPGDPKIFSKYFQIWTKNFLQKAVIQLPFPSASI